MPLACIAHDLPSEPQAVAARHRVTFPRHGHGASTKQRRRAPEDVFYFEDRLVSPANMKLAYKFSALCGLIYTKGNLVFTDNSASEANATSVLSPVGNRVSKFDLVHHQLTTFDWAMKRSIRIMALSPNGIFLVVIDEEGRALLVNYQRQVVLAHFNLKQKVKRVAFSPDSQYFAVSYMKMVQIWRVPLVSNAKEFAPLIFHVKIRAHFDQISSLDWSFDSRYLLTASKDMTVKVLAVNGPADYVPFTLSGHKDALVAAYFSSDMQTIYSVSKEGALYIWKWQFSDDAPAKDGYWIHPQNGKYVLSDKKYFGQVGQLTAVAFHRSTGFLCIGLSTGIFSIVELPDFNVLQSMNVFQGKINSIAFNSTGEWISFGSIQNGQLLVWEWQSETFVLKQQGHYFDVTCVAYSNEGETIATGGEDGKVKLWQSASAFSFITFSDHTGPVTDLVFTKKGRVLLSAAADGTVRAYDLIRYRQFRILSSSTPMSFSSLAADASGEIVMAASWDSFEIYVWSLQTGQLLELLSGHQGPITALSFDPLSKYLVSGSMDKTIRTWSLYSDSNASEAIGRSLSRNTLVQTFDAGSEILDLDFRPDGKEIAVALLNGMITFWHPEYGTQVASIDGAKDASGGRKLSDKRTAASSTSTRHFTRLCYSADSSLLIAGGDTMYICIYDTGLDVIAPSTSFQRALLKQFQISANLDFDGVQEKLNSKLLTEAGRLELISGVGHGDEESLYGAHKASLDDSDEEEQLYRMGSALPGTDRGGDLGVRKVRPEIRTKDLRFSPDGRSWAAATTEGLQLYSLDDFFAFDPLDLNVDITPDAIRATLHDDKKYSLALLMALRLNDTALLKEVFISIPGDHVYAVVSELPSTNAYLDKLLAFVASLFHRLPIVQLLLMWTSAMIKVHGYSIRKRLLAATNRTVDHPSHSVVSIHTTTTQQSRLAVLNALRAIHKSISSIYAPLSQL